MRVSVRSDSYLSGPLTALGLAAAAAVCALDQATKLWLIFVYDLARRGPVALAPVLDLRLNWNPGISYGLLQQQGIEAQWALLSVNLAAIVLLWVWLARTATKLSALSLGLVIGGAAGNMLDRLILARQAGLPYGAVADFVHFHVGGFSWYVFNLADAAIVAGVVGLLYDSFFGDRAPKAP